MDCGIPFCHQGCPVDNLIPDWNDLVYQGDWRAAIDVLHSHQQLSRVHRPHLPRAVRRPRALNIDDALATIRTIEASIVEKAWAEGWIKPQIAAHKTGKAESRWLVPDRPEWRAAQQLARAASQCRRVRKTGRYRWSVALWHP